LCMKITPCWFVGNWIAAWYPCRLRSQLLRAWVTSHQPRCLQRSIQRRPMCPTRAHLVQAAARAAMVEAAGWITALLVAALAREKVVLTAAAGAVPAKAPAAAAKANN